MAKRSTRRTLAGIGLLACFAAVAVTGCGGGTKYSDNNNGDGSGIVGGVDPGVTGNAPVLSTSGTRGTILLTTYPNGVVLDATTPLSYFLVSPTLSEQLAVPAGSVLGVPELYADRKFDHFELNGTQVSVGTPSLALDRIILSLSSLPATINGSLKAVYVPYDPGAGVQFTPNYNQVDNARWDSMPVKVYLDKSVTPSEGARTRIIAGMDKWVKASGGIISYVLVPNDGSANISLYTADSLDSLGTPDSFTLAVTLSDREPSPSGGYLRLKKSFIYFPANRFYGQGGAEQKLFEATVAHEFGHALGITGTNSGHSPNPGDLMSTFANDIGEVTENDIATIANIYRKEYDAAK